MLRKKVDYLRLVAKDGEFVSERYAPMHTVFQAHHEERSALAATIDMRFPDIGNLLQWIVFPIIFVLLIDRFSQNHRLVAISCLALSVYVIVAITLLIDWLYDCRVTYITMKNFRRENASANFNPFAATPKFVGGSPALSMIKGGRLHRSVNLAKRRPTGGSLSVDFEHS